MIEDMNSVAEEAVAETPVLDDAAGPQPDARDEEIAALKDRLLRDAAQGRLRDETVVELVRVGEPGVPAHWIAILRSGSRDLQIAASIERATSRWRLRPRPRQVLEAVVRGQPTATIAAELGISTRTIELHITALFDRAQVDCRVELVAAVLGE